MSQAYFHNNPQEFSEAYIAFGRIAVYWGAIEVALEDILIFVRLRTGTNEVKSFPTGFSSLCSELAKRWPADPHFAEYRPEVDAIIEEAKCLHDIRVVVVHGTCHGFFNDSLLGFGKSKRRDGWAYMRHDFELAALVAAADGMLALQERLRPLNTFVHANWQRKADGSPYYWQKEQPGRY